MLQPEKLSATQNMQNKLLIPAGEYTSGAGHSAWAGMQGSRQSGAQPSGWAQKPLQVMGNPGLRFQVHCPHTRCNCSASALEELAPSSSITGPQGNTSS